MRHWMGCLAMIAAIALLAGGCTEENAAATGNDGGGWVNEGSDFGDASGDATDDANDQEADAAPVEDTSPDEDDPGSADSGPSDEDTGPVEDTGPTED
ncbi:MAG: hypothetical protein ACLFVJ_23725, partial [Persicimonas sp.]